MSLAHGTARGEHSRVSTHALLLTRYYISNASPRSDQVTTHILISHDSGSLSAAASASAVLVLPVHVTDSAGFHCRELFL